MFFDIFMFQKSEIQKSTNYFMGSTLRAFERAITLTQAISQSAYQFAHSYGFKPSPSTLRGCGGPLLLPTLLSRPLPQPLDTFGIYATNDVVLSFV